MDQRLACVVVTVIGLGLLGCTKKTNTAPNDGTAATGAGGTGTGGTGTGGTGTATGTPTGTGGATGTGGMTGAVAMNIPCGTTKCAGTAPGTGMMMGGGMGGFMLAQVCCADATPDKEVCGSIATTGTMSGQCVGPAVSAPLCPKAFGGAVGTCCTPDKLCGIDGSLQGMGCQELGALKARIPAQFAAMFMLPDPLHCDGTPVDTGNDAGATAH